MHLFQQQPVAKIQVCLILSAAIFITCLPLNSGQWRLFPTRNEEKAKNQRSKFLLILLDGFAASYLGRHNLPAFNFIKRNGVHARYMVPQFPTISYPNFYSIQTGRYVEHHHMSLNTMYDEKTDTTFDSSPKWWNKAETMWISTTRAGLRTRVYLWPGCEVPINGTQPEYCLKYSLNPWTNQLQGHLRDIVQRFADDSADVGFVYCEQPDLFGHIFGPESNFVTAALLSIDKIIQDFLADMVNHNIHDEVNLVIVSDHGMTTVGPTAARKIPLANHIDADDVKKILEIGAVVGVYPVPGKLDQVYNRLKKMPGMSVWKREEIPESYHFKLADTAPPILILAHKGYYIKGVPNTEKQLPQIPYIGIAVIDFIVQGFHGYDANEVTDMRGIFFAIGPAFKKNFTLQPIFNKDVYNLAMHVLGVPAVKNDGNWTAVAPALQTPP